jgi:acyl carrier protein
VWIVKSSAEPRQAGGSSYGWMTDFTPAVPWTMLAARRGRPRPMSDAADEIADKVVEMVARHLGVAEAKVVPTASFIDDLGADSLDTVELIMAFEETFSIEVPEEAAEKIITVQDAIDYIAAAKKGA